MNGVTRLRLVVDFRKSNENVSRSFPRIAEIRQYVKAVSRYFLVLNLAHGYHQIALSDQASKYTTFIISTGKEARRYRFLRVPHGLNVLGAFISTFNQTKYFHIWMELQNFDT